MKGTPNPASHIQLYNQADGLKLQIQAIKKNSAKTKQLLRDLRHPVKHKAKAIQQMVSDMDPQYNVTFADLPQPVDATQADKVVHATDSLMKTWHEATTNFMELKIEAM